MEGEYTGHVKDGKLNGVGVCVYMDGSRYQGDWKQGLKSGRGTHSFASGAPRRRRNSAAAAAASPRRARAPPTNSRASGRMGGCTGSACTPGKLATSTSAR